MSSALGALFSVPPAWYIAWYPSIVFLAPVVILSAAKYPIAVLPAPSVKAVSASLPIATVPVWPLPAVDFIAFWPIATTPVITAAPPVPAVPPIITLPSELAWLILIPASEPMTTLPDSPLSAFLKAL